MSVSAITGTTSLKAACIELLSVMLLSLVVSFVVLKFYFNIGLTIFSLIAYYYGIVLAIYAGLFKA